RPVEQRFVKVKSIPEQAPEDNTAKIARLDETISPVPPGPVSSLADNHVVPARTLPVDKRKTIVLSTLGKRLDDSTGAPMARINAREAGKIFAAERVGHGFTYSRRSGYNQE